MVAAGLLQLDNVACDSFLLQADGNDFVKVSIGLRLPIDELFQALSQVKANCEHQRSLSSSATAEVSSGQKCVVKNTFLTVEEEHQNFPNLPRTRTSPPTIRRLETAERLRKEACVEEGDEDEEEEQDEGQHPLPNLARARSTGIDGLARTNTNDPFEDTGVWSGAWGVPEAQGFPMVPPFMNPMLAGAMQMHGWDFINGGWYPGFDPALAMTPGMAFQQSVTAPPGMHPASGASTGGRGGAAAKAQQMSTGVALQASPGQQVRQAFIMRTGSMQVQWTITQAMVKGEESEFESSRFSLSLGADFPNVPFKMKIRSGLGEASSSKSFKDVDGKGYIELVCEGDITGTTNPGILFSFSVGEGKRKQALQQPVLHDFASKPACLLGAAHWDLGAALGRRADGMLTLEVLPTSAAADGVESHKALLCEREEIVSEEEDQGASLIDSQGVSVKHTFIHMDIADAPPGLPRTQTEPAKPSSYEGGPGGPSLGSVPESEGSQEAGGAPVYPGGPTAEQIAAFGQNSLRDINVEELMQHEPAPVKPQMLHRTFDPESACMRFEWVVGARKLTSSDTHPHVSPAFGLDFGDGVVASFKMMIYPHVVNDKKGGASFKKANGRGYIELACEDELRPDVQDVRFRIAIGSGDKRMPARGPVSHNFGEKAVSGLPKKDALWDFTQAVDKATSTFVVVLEVLSDSEEKPKQPVKRW